MVRLKNIIASDERWQSLLMPYITLIEDNKVSNPNVALDGAKTLLESISKTILADKGIDVKPNSDLSFLVKKAFHSIPVAQKISTEDETRVKSMLGSLENISKNVGEFRNDYGFFSHGQDLQTEKFDTYLVEFAVASSDLLASFLLSAHMEVLEGRSRIYYEECEEFNKFVDDTNAPPKVGAIELISSKALYSDIEAYKTGMLEFVSKKSDLISQLGTISNTIDVDIKSQELIDLQAYLTEDEIKQIVHINFLVMTGTLYKLLDWIKSEKSHILSDSENEQLKNSFTGEQLEME
jgi:hypothetical protein